MLPSINGKFGKIVKLKERSPMAVYDVFTFYDEFELLLVRLREHASFVDHFILIQGDSNFTGKPKPFHFPNSDAR
ncbi:MAG: hypothetical protein EB120_12465, partial [Proteobacteria bacterium]|nr:hypothetical protein [Pseudomonadota bacterium]